MTTIITKNGSGAPTAGQLSEGELAVDLTNKELYTKSGSTVIKIGAQGGSTGTFTDLTATSSFTSPGIDDNATATAITVEPNGETKLATSLTVEGTYPAMDSQTPGSLGSRFVTTGSNMLMASLTSAGAYASDIYKVGLSETGPTKHTWTTTTAGSAMVLTDGGNLGIGTDAPGTALDVLGSGKSIRTRDTGANACTATMIASNNFAYLQVARTSGANPSRAELTARGNSSDLEFENYQGHIAKIDHQSTGEFSFQMDAAAQASMTFNTGTAEAMRITQAGTVGIGLSSPNSATALHVAASSTNGLTGAGLFRLQNTQANACSIGFYTPVHDWTMGAGNASDFSLYNVTDNVTPFYVDTQAPNQALRLEENSVNIKYNPATAGTGQVLISANASGVDGVISFPLAGTSKGSIITNKSLSFHTNTTTNTTNERMRIDASGNVGIGTAAPVSYQQGPVLNIGDTGDSYAQLNFTTATNGIQYIGFGDATSGTGRYQGLISFDHNTNRMGFGTIGSTTPNMSIDALGNVGIGTNAPQTKLHVTQSAEDGSDGIRLSRSNSAATYTHWVDPTARYNIGYSNPATADPAEALLSLDGGNGRVGIGKSNTESLRLEVQAPTGFSVGSGFYSASAQSTITFSDSATTAAYKVRVGSEGDDLLMFAGGSERMRIDSTGNLLVGRTSTSSASSDYGTQLYSSGIIYQYTAAAGSSDMHRWYNSAGTLAANLAGNGNMTITGVYSPSDERLKENIVDAPAGNLDDLQVRSYDWKADGSHVTHGFIAQELEVVAPYAVTRGEDEDAMLAVDFTKLVPMMIKEIQDLKAEVAALKGA